MFGLSNLKLIAIGLALALVAGVPAWAAWKLGAANKAEEIQADADKRVEDVRKDMDQLLMKERQITDHYKGLADSGYAKLMEKIGSIKVEHVTINRNITAERAANPEFYEQQLPAGGLKQWDASRKQFQ